MISVWRKIKFVKSVLFCASRASHIMNFHLPYIRYFKDLGYNVDVAVQGKINNVNIDNCFDLTFTKNPLSPNNVKTIFKLKKILVNGGYDIVCSNTTLAGVTTRAAVMLMKGKRPSLIHISHGYMFSEHGGIKSKIYLMCERATSRPVDRLVVMNSEDYYLAEKYHLGKSLHYIYGMGVSKERFPILSYDEIASVRTKRLGADNNSFIILCVGEFSARKNQAVLIQAFAALSEIHKNLILVFAGDGDTLNECKDKVMKYELENKVRFLGQVDDVNKLYRSCDLLVSASKMEGLPFNIMEALICELPVIASDIKGHNDLIQNNKNGFLFEKDNISELVKIMNRLISDSELYTYIKSNTYLPQEYLIENVKPKLLEILDENYTAAEKKAYTVEKE